MSKTREKRAKFYAVSNAHLDTQWNWTVRDSIRDSLKNTLDYNFRLFKKYPSYKMNFEGAFRYKLMKEYYPRKYRILKKYVKEGRWNAVGATWDAMDVNVPSGESLIRQILLGNNFFEKEFGQNRISEDIFLPDCFGFRASLPSIEAHMGLIGFSTQKLVWGAGAPLIRRDGKVLAPMPESDLPRLDLGRWIGPDGKGVFVSLLEGNYTYNFDKDGDERPIKERPEILEAIEHNRKYSGVPARSMYFGTGDYGGSCSDGSARLLENAVRDPGGAFDVAVASPTEIYRDLTEEEKAALPVYEGGLLIPHGYGAMTSHTAMKLLNRRNETLADRTERAANAAKYLAGEPYPKDRINEAYKTFLWHQFHDDLTGTSIADAYLISHSDELLANNVLSGEYENALSAVSARMNTKGPGTPLVVFNPSATERTCAVSLPVDMKKATVYKGSKRLPTCFDGKEASFVTALAPCSFTVFHVREESRRFTSSLRVKKTLIENERLRVRIGKGGNVASIYDKALERELLQAPVEFEIYPDHSTVWPSWEYTLKDLSSKPKTLPASRTVEIVDRRPVWVGLKIRKTFGNSVFETLVRLDAGSSRVLFENTVFWYERASNLFVRFPLAAANDFALFDSDPGEVKGGVTDSEPYYVHNVHLWADQKDASGAFGTVVASDCKYAMQKKDEHTLSLGIIHTPAGDFMPESGQDFQDLGRNVFSFTIEGYGKDRRQALCNAEALNHPVAAVVTEAHGGAFREFSFLELSGSGAMLTAVKEEEKGDLLILRVRETEGKKETGLRISFPENEILALYECDGYERVGGALPFEEHAFTFDIGKYTLRSFALKLKKKVVVKPKTVPLDLPRDRRVFTKRGEASNGKTLPLEQFSPVVRASGASFRLEKGTGNACACRGQDLALPEGTRTLRLLAASAGEGKAFGFLLDGKRFAVNVSSMFGVFGSAESAVSGTPNEVRSDSVAQIFTHTHDEKGNDGLYDLAYLYDVRIPVDGVRTVRLPDDPDLLVFSALADFCPPASPVSSPKAKEEPAGELPFRRLTVEGGRGSGEYKEGALLRVCAPLLDKDGLFTGFEGEGITQKNGRIAIVKIGKKDLTVRVLRKKLGEDLAENRPCRANHEMNARETAANAFNGDGRTKWCGKCGENGVCTLTVDLQKVRTVSSFLILHAGACENKFWNTSDFEIQTKEKEKDDWTTAVKVRGNKEDLTVHNVDARKARFVRLFITSPARDNDLHARIYAFKVFEKKIPKD